MLLALPDLPQALGYTGRAPALALYREGEGWWWWDGERKGAAGEVPLLEEVLRQVEARGMRPEALALHCRTGFLLAGRQKEAMAYPVWVRDRHRKAAKGRKESEEGGWATDTAGG